VKGIARPLDEVAPTGIEAVAGGFNLRLDPTALDHTDTELARKALQQALAALEAAGSGEESPSADR
jgi:hypothetical protein